MRLEPAECRRLFAAARVARLATIGPSGPHIVPIVFAVVGSDGIVSAVDHKPKQSRELTRLANIAKNPAVSVLADHYDEDWSRLWWVRADGTAVVGTDPAGIARVAAALAEKYPQYLESPPAGPALTVTVAGWSGWTSSPIE